jgi:hypothetical protein
MNVRWNEDMYVVNPQDRANFDPMAFIWTNLVNTHWKIVHADYLNSICSDFLKEKFLKFYYISFRKSMTPPDRGQFWLKGFYLNHLGRHSQEDFSCLLSKLYLFGFFKRKVFKFLLYSDKENQWPRGLANFDLRALIWTNLVDTD